MQRLLCALSLVGAQGPAWSLDWMVSLIEGDAVVTDGTQRLVAKAGLRLALGAIVETGDKTVLVRLEASDQSTFDLGAQTRVMLAPARFPPRSDRVPQLYVLQGWVKATAQGGNEAGGLLTPTLEVLPFKGSFVLQALRSENFVFVENGRATLMERRAGASATAVNAGEFYSAQAGRQGSVAPRPTPEWLKALPGVYRDTIPSRAAALRDRPPQRELLPGPTYAQLADWLGAEATLRRPLAARFTPLATDPQFRAALRSNMRNHPEWGPILDPPPPPPPAPAPPRVPPR